MKNLRKKAISFLLVVLIALSGTMPIMSAFAGDGVEGFYDLQIFYKDTNTIVPTKNEETGDDYVEYMIEGQKLNLKYVLIDSVWPNNGYVKWYSDAPALVDVDQEGVVKAFDSSKGAVIHVWIDNEVKTIPLIGSALGSALEKVFFNEYVNLDSMDTDEIVGLLEKFFGSGSWIAGKAEGYEGQLIDSLRSYLDKANTGIHCELYDGSGTKVGEDVINIVVQKNEEWYAMFLPNGTHITNKSQIPTTVAKGSQVQLYGIVTPQRLGFGTVYSVKSTSIFSTGKVVATVNDSGLVSFKNKGTVTIMCSPDSEDVIEGILKFVNYFYQLENTGTLDTDKIAGILIDYVGIDMNRTVLAGILDVCFAIADIAGDAADPVQLTATAVEILANIILQFTYNDTITFTVVDAQPIESFELDGVTTVKEGNEIQLQVTNIVPTTGDTSDIVWSSSDPSIASVDPKTGVIKGLDAGGNLGAMSSQTCMITATSTTNDKSRTVTITVTGKTGKSISHVDINGRDVVPIDSSEKYTYTVYPRRVAESENLFVKWGVYTGDNEDGEPQYIWASEDSDAVDPDEAGKIDYRGNFTPIRGGATTIAIEAKTGYRLSDGSFYEISKETAIKKVQTGIPVESIHIDALDGTSNGDINRDQTVTINGKDYRYITIHKSVAEAYYNNGATLSATIYPANATDKSVRWVCDNNDFNVEPSGDTLTVDIKQKANKEYANTFNVYAVSNDGEIISNVITVCVTRNYATGNTINEESIEMVNGKTANANHTMSFSGSWTSGAYACYRANWYSSDESIFTVANRGNDNSDAVLTARDVGTATLYCVSADGAFVDSIEVRVKPNKERLKGIIDNCEKSIILKTNANKADYQTYLRKLDKANIVMYEEDMASQLVCDTVANDLLAAFIKIGGFIGIAGVEVLGTGKTEMKTDFVTVKVGSTSNYKNYSYDFDYKLKPTNAMYSNVEWSSSNSSVSVDKNGVCKPTSNDPCSAVITCTVTDYNGGQQSASKVVAFARTKATSVTLNKTEITGAKIGQSEQLTATIEPTNLLGNSSASVQDCRWYTTNPNIVTVSNSGVVTFVYGGTASVICETMDGGYRATCRVTVTTNYDNLRLLINQYNDLSLREESFYPETWAPYIEAKAKAEGILERHASTQEEVDAAYSELKTAYDNLKKFVDIQRVELYLDNEATSEFYQYDLSLLREGISYKNAKLNLKVRLYPNNATYQSVTWESSTTDIAVSNEGVASPTSEKRGCYGRITCTVIDSFGREFSDDVWVSFSYVPVTAVRVSMDSITGTIGSTYQLTTVIEPTGTSLIHAGGASIKDYFWESDDENVATVNQKGLVTFVGAGSTKVRCVSYDGGKYGECLVSSQGDRTALKAALDEYADVDYTLYAYNYGMAFKTAYEEAETALSDDGLNQEDIDQATSNLISAASRLADHPYINVDSIALTWQSKKRNLANSSSDVASGSIGSNNAVGIDLSGGYSNYNEYNDLIVNASSSPSNAMYKNVTWDILESKNISYSTSAARITFTPSKREEGAWAKVRVNYVNHYDAVFSRIFYVALTDNPTNSLSVSETNIVLKGSDTGHQLQCTVNDNAEFKNIIYTSSNTDVATVNANGVVVPVDVGTCKIYVKTLYGGITREVNVTITADLSVLVNKVAEYTELLNNAQGTNEFTQDSLDALAEELANSRAIINDNTASQREVNEALQRLEIARNNLEGYVAAEGINIVLSRESADTTVVNPGFIRYSNGASINGKTMQLVANLIPEGSRYQTISWTSDNSSITVNSDGIVTNSSVTGSVAKITCTITTIYGQTYSDSVYVSFVRYPVTGLSFTEENIYGNINDTVSVPVKFESENRITGASIKDAIYSSSNEGIATVDNEGVVTFHSQGEATITVTALDGGYTATITAITTWDTSALKEAVSLADALVLTDYAYAYSQVFDNKKTAAKAVLENPYASQQQIDTACAELSTAMTEMIANPFVAPTARFTTGGQSVVNNMSYNVDTDTNQIVIDYTLSGMYKSAEVSTANANGATAVVNNSSIVITKSASTASIDLVAVFVDDYDRESAEVYTINLVDTIVNIESISITYGDEVIETSKTFSGYRYTYSDFTPFNLSYVSNTPNSSAPISVVWSISDSTYITIDSATGLVNLTNRGKLRSTNTANVTCTVKNADGSTVRKTISLTIAL